MDCAGRWPGAEAEMATKPKMFTTDINITKLHLQETKKNDIFYQESCFVWNSWQLVSDDQQWFSFFISKVHKQQQNQDGHSPTAQWTTAILPLLCRQTARRCASSSMLLTGHSWH
jgi:hypothetical protein